MLKNTTFDDRYDLLDIEGFKYSDLGLTDDDLACLLNLNIIFLSEYPKWYMLDGELYYYKTYHIYDELFLNELIKQFNLRSVKYQLVKNGDEVGIISKSFRKKPSKFYDYDDYFKHKGIEVPRTLVSLDKELSKILTEENKKKMMDDFYKLLAFDIFIGQLDRGDYNLNIEEKTETSLAPIFDNGCSLVDYFSYNSSFDSIYLPLKKYGGCVDEDNIYFFNLIKNNRILYEYLCKCLDINVLKVLKSTIEKNHIIVPYGEKRELESFFDKRKDKIDYTLKLMQHYK